MNLAELPHRYCVIYSMPLVHAVRLTKLITSTQFESEKKMIVTTTQSIEGYKITGYYGIVFGEVIAGINIFKDFGAGIRNIVGGRSQGYEDELLSARTEALQELEQRAAEMGAHAVVGVDMDYEVLGQGNMLMVTASGTAVTVAPE